MRLLAILAVTVVAGCSSLGATEQSLAQCQLEANEPRGIKFLKDYIGIPPAESTKEQAYSAFLITCMKAKGYDFAEIFDDAAKINEPCWYENDEGIIESKAGVFGARCFSRSWW